MHLFGGDGHARVANHTDIVLFLVSLFVLFLQNHSELLFLQSDSENVDLVSERAGIVGVGLDGVK